MSALKKLVFRPDEPPGASFPEDIRRIVQVFADRGYELSETDAELAWEKRSEAWCASWLALPEKDEYIFMHCMHFLKEVEEVEEI